MKFETPKWRVRFMELAAHVAEWSKDSTKVGAVVVGDNHTVLSKGYNGFPRGFDDDIEERHQRPMKYDYSVHAEMNAIYNAAFNGVSLSGTTMYVYPLHVCHECAKGIIQSGIKRLFVLQNKSEPPPQWVKSMHLAARMLEEGGVEYRALNL